MDKQSTVDPPTMETKRIDSIKQAYFIHIVKWDGESLSLISRWYLGNFEDWKLLARHNSELNPSNIHVGDRVWVPKYQMITSKPMTKSFLESYNKKKHKPIIKKTNESEKKPIELYGPKEHEEENEEYSHDQ